MSRSGILEHNEDNVFMCKNGKAYASPTVRSTEVEKVE